MEKSEKKTAVLEIDIQADTESFNAEIEKNIQQIEKIIESLKNLEIKI